MFLLISLTVGTGILAETMEEHYLLGWFLSLTQFAFLYHPRLPAQGGSPSPTIGWTFPHQSLM